ncbi:PGPGW domain-containing protein (plasmid) [Verrucomicrobiaceae bacterium 227]
MSTIKKYFKKLKSGKPGQRFKEFHEYRNEHRKKSDLHSRALTASVGVILTIFGIAVGWLPGPGGVIGIFGLAILSTELKPLAIWLDALEGGLYKILVSLIERWKDGGIAFRSITIISGLILFAAGVWLVMKLLAH